MPKKSKTFKKEEEPVIESYAPKGEELELQEFLDKRITFLKTFRNEKLPGVNRTIEDIWKEADKEYQPHQLGETSGRKRLESDEETGLRSRLVKVGSDTEWQSDSASPDFYVKVNTALSILVDQNPEAVFLPTSSKYEANTQIAYNNWKNSWEISGAKQQLKNFIFNLAKYGTAYMRTYPKIIEVPKKVMTEYYPNDPTKNKFEDRIITKYNDLCRESINPWQVWDSETTRVGDQFSREDWYFEKDFSWAKFQETFKDYPNIVYAAKGSKITETSSENNAEIKTEPDTITVGFYESEVKDLYSIWIPSTKVVIYYSPLQNDEGKLSLSSAIWSMRDDRTSYGIGLYEIIREDSIMYDRLSNMTMDQLTLSIYKDFFYKGTDLTGENQEIKIGPGVGHRVTDPNAMTFLDVPGPGAEAWKGLAYLQERRDLNSGVNQQLASKFESKTLGQDIQAKEAALQRMKAPLDFILDALQNEAYISLSWQKQILSTPEVLEYSTIEDVMKALQESGLNEQDMQAYMTELQSPKENSDLFFNETQPQPEQPITEGQDGQMIDNTVPPKKFMNIYPEAPYGLEQDTNGELIESEKRRFYRFGTKLSLGRLDWKGMIRVKPQSVLAPSKELTKRMKLELYNLVIPTLQQLLANPMAAPILLPPLKQILKVYEEDVKQWVDEKAIGELAQMMAQSADKKEEPSVSIPIKWELLLPDVQSQILEKYLGIKVVQPLFINKGAGPAGIAKPVDEGGQPPTPDNSGGEQFKPLVPPGEIDSGSMNTPPQQPQLQQ